MSQCDICTLAFGKPTTSAVSKLMCEHWLRRSCQGEGLMASEQTGFTVA